MGQGKAAKTGLGLMAALMLSGCMNNFEFPTRGGLGFLGGQDAVAPAADGAPALEGELSNGERSALIDALLARRSALEGGSFARVAEAVLAANARVAEAELRAAMLRAEARELNWLPSLGPQISLTSMGSLVTTLVVDQVLFDNGGKRAEREFARADVEVAAVALVQDSNDRVLAGLSLYLEAQAAKARAQVTQGAMARMERLHYMMSERVRVGVDDPADLQYVNQRLSQMRSDLAADEAAARTAMAELAAMSEGDLSGLSGLSTVGAPSLTATPLDVMKAEAEATRAVAEAQAARAGYLPGLSASGSIGSGGADGGLNVNIPNGFGFGRGADMAALEAQQQAAAARVDQERETAARQVAALQSDLTSLRRQLAEAQGLADQARANYDTFEQQLQGGQRSITEVVGVFQTRINAERELVQLRHDIARAELKLAAIHGNLVNGEDV